MPLDDPEWLERMYNNRARVPEHGERVSRIEGNPELLVMFQRVFPEPSKS